MRLHRKAFAKYCALYYKASAKHFPALLLVLQSLHKALPKYYFVLQSLHKVPSNTTLHYKACKKYFPTIQPSQIAVPMKINHDKMNAIRKTIIQKLSPVV
jgi:hypothetical protein